MSNKTVLDCQRTQLSGKICVVYRPDNSVSLPVKKTKIDVGGVADQHHLVKREDLGLGCGNSH